MSGQYNGFTPAERAKGGAAYNAAIRSGVVKSPTQCEACQAAEGVTGHNEDYETPLQFFEVCFLCHMMIHCRYRDVGRWQLYLSLLDEGAVLARVSGWPEFREKYLSGDLDALVVAHAEPREPSFLHALPTAKTDAPPDPMPIPARLGGGFR